MNDGCYEQFIQVVVLRCWVLDVVIFKVNAIEAICNYICISLGGFVWFLWL